MVSLREKRDEGKKRQHTAAMDKANTLKFVLETKMKALTKEEGQWRWKRCKEARNLDVEKQALQAKEVAVQLAKKKIARGKSALREGSAALERDASRMGKTCAKLVADKKVE